MFEFLKRMWQMNRIDEEYLQNTVAKGLITEEQQQSIVLSPQLSKEI